MKSVAERVTGPLYAYLGHFKNPKWLEQGHNDIDDAENQDQTIAQFYQGRAPTDVSSTL
jgi:hypothetical protein